MLKCIGNMKPLLSAILVSCLLLACKREEPTTWNSDVLVPLAEGRVTLSDIVADSLLYTDDQGLWYLHFQENLTDFDLDSLVAIPDTTIEKIFDVPLIGGPFNLPNGTVLFDQDEENLIKADGANLKEVILESGTLHYKIKSYVNGYLSCSYSLPGVTLNGVSTLIETVTQPSIGNDPFVYEGELNLAGYHIDFTGTDGNSSNRIATHLYIATSPDAPQSALVYGDDYIAIELEFLSPKVYYARGYFGEHEYDLDETISFGDDINLPQGLMKLDEANMNLHIENGVGADMEMTFQQVASYNSNYNSTVGLDHDPLFEPIHITRAMDYDGIISHTTYDLLLNQGNSNITDFIGNLPDQLDLQAHVHLNPLGDVTNAHDFIYTHDAIQANVDLTIPLKVATQELVLSDTLELNNNFEITADGQLILHVENAFPFKARIQAQIINEMDNAESVLIQDQWIDAATLIDNAGHTVPALSQLHVPVNAAVISDLNAHQRIALRIQLDTPNYPQTYGIYDFYYMQFQLIADGQYLIELK